MTKRIASDNQAERDRPVEAQTLSGNEFSEIVQDRQCGVAEFSHRIQHWFTLKGLALPERYLEGVIEIVVWYRNVAAHGEICAAVVRASNALDDSHLRPFWTVQRCSGREVICRSWQDALMFIGDVKQVEIVQSMLPSRVRLNFVTNEVPDRDRGAISFAYMSVDGTLYRSPILTSEREAAIFSRAMAISLNEDAVCVVQGGPEIVDCIAQHNWRMPGNVDGLNRPSLFERALVILGTESFCIVSHKAPKQQFEIIDVLVGPFDLEQRTGEVGHVSHH